MCWGSGMAFIIIGAGGHGKVVLDAARAAGLEPAFFVDKNPPVDMLSDIPVYKNIAAAKAAGQTVNLTHFIVAVGNNENRATEFALYLQKDLTPLNIIHPTATLATGVQLGQGVYIGARAVINPDATIGDNAIINTGALVEHDCTVGKHAFVAPGAIMCGETAIGDYTLLAAGATLIPTVSVGAHALIAAGAVVTKPAPDHSRLFGIPASPNPPEQDPQ